MISTTTKQTTHLSQYFNAIKKPKLDFTSTMAKLSVASVIFFALICVIQSLRDALRTPFSALVMVGESGGFLRPEPKHPIPTPEIAPISKSYNGASIAYARATLV